METPREAAAGRPGYIVLATPALAGRFAGGLSGAHEREVRELSRVGPMEAVRLSLAVSREAYAVLDSKGIPLFLMGVEQPGAIGRSALVWMLGSAAAGRHPARVLRSARWGVGRAFAVTRADRLLQFIPGWYAVGRAFALRLGFRLTPLPGRDGEKVFLATLSQSDFATKGERNGSRNHKHP